MALLHALRWLPDSHRMPLAVAFYAHGLQPETDDRSQKLVAAAAAQLGVPLVVGRASPRKQLPKRADLGEKAARDARYAFLAETAKRVSAVAVAVGHTLDDQAETLLFRLARGTGLRGAGAMSEWSHRSGQEMDTSIDLFRPLLTVTREDTGAACAEMGTAISQDPSNSSLRVARNRLRHRVLPELRLINSQAAAHLARFASSVQADAAFLDSLAQEAIQPHERRSPGTVIWSRQALQATPRILRARVFQSAWEWLCGAGAALSQRHLASMDTLLSGPSGKAMTLPHGMVFSLSHQRCVLGVPSVTESLSEGDVVVQVPGRFLVGAWTVDVGENVIGPSVVGGAQDSLCAVLDADALGSELRVRRRKPGDRFHPLGLSGPKRLQDFFVDAKIAREERDAIPLLLGRLGIAWVVGHRVAAWAAVVPSTQRFLTIAFRKEEKPP